jgi:hypothetical protein
MQVSSLGKRWIQRKTVNKEKREMKTSKTKSLELTSKEVSADNKNLYSLTTGTASSGLFFENQESDLSPSLAQSLIVQAEDSSTLLKKKEKSSKQNIKLSLGQVEGVDGNSELPSLLVEKFKRDPKKRTKLLFPSNTLWYNHKLSPLKQHSSSRSLCREHSDLMKLYAKKLLEMETKLYNNNLGEKNSSDLNWMSTVAASGTFHDKLAAKIVLMQESMIHNLDSLLSVILLTQKKKRESLKALDCLKSLWITDLLPENRKLKFFYEQNLYDAASSDAHLLLIYFEDQVKVAYSTYLQALEKHLSDSQYSIKNNLIQILLELLIERPEQEKVLLSLLVNKMGDPDRQLASKISHYLNRLLQRHPRMKLVIVNEVEQFLRRPNMTLQAQLGVPVLFLYALYSVAVVAGTTRCVF